MLCPGESSELLEQRVPRSLVLVVLCGAPRLGKLLCKFLVVVSPRRQEDGNDNCNSSCRVLASGVCLDKSLLFRTFRKGHVCISRTSLKVKSLASPYFCFFLN